MKRNQLVEVTATGSMDLDTDRLAQLVADQIARATIHALDMKQIGEAIRMRLEAKADEIAIAYIQGMDFGGVNKEAVLRNFKK